MYQLESYVNEHWSRIKKSFWKLWQKNLINYPEILYASINQTKIVKIGICYFFVLWIWIFNQTKFCKNIFLNKNHKVFKNHLVLEMLPTTLLVSCSLKVKHKHLLECFLITIFNWKKLTAVLFKNKCWKSYFFSKCKSDFRKNSNSLDTYFFTFVGW